jgi:glycosyltransferase involved in cell wall biosynthesis
MRRKLIDRKIPRELIHIAENWADGEDIPAGAPRKSRTLNILYSGNLGLSHDTDTILGAIRHFRNDPRFVFTFSGGGVGKVELEKLCKAEGLDRVRFMPYSNRDQIGKHLAKGDIGLVTEHPGHIGIVVPSKIYGVLAAARPILFIGPKRSTADLLIRRFGFGWQIDPGDQAGLIALLERLAADRGEIRRRGRRARRIFERYYDRPRGVARIAAIIGAGSGAPVAPRNFSRAQAPLQV